jgi:hypothetical protein
MPKLSNEASLFRAFHMTVPEEVREELFNRIMDMHIKGNQNKFEELCVLVLAYVASGKIPPSVGATCRDLLALVLHSISMRALKAKGQTDAELATAVANSINAAKDQVRMLEQDVLKSDVLTMEDLEKQVLTIDKDAK